MALSAEVNGESFEWKEGLREADIRRTGGQDPAHGPWVGLEAAGQIPGREIGLKVEYRLLEQSPLLIWRVRISNHGKYDLKLQSLDLMRVGENADRSSRIGMWLNTWRQRHQGSREKADFWLMDGWQSWSFAGTLVDENIITGTRLGPATKPMYLNPSSNHRGRVSEMFALLGNRAEQVGWLVGQLSERQAFGSLHAQPFRERATLRLNNSLDGVLLGSEDSFTTDWAAVQPLDLSHPEPNAPYLEAVARENQARRESETPVGWCSWYYFFEDVTERDIRDHVEWIAENRDSLPLQLVQIDDGYQREIGDWLERKETFPSGHQQVVKEIEAAGLTPGLWLAPFIAVPQARIVAEHPEWVLRNERGRPVRAGYNWGTFFIALDLTNPE
ncbi:MAG: alpha-galactosidase, partial [Anaerolineales bacterium]